MYRYLFITAVFIVFLVFVSLTSLTRTGIPQMNTLGPHQRYLIVDDSVIEKIAEATGLDIDANGNLIDREHPSGFTAAKEQSLKETFVADVMTATAAAQPETTPEPSE